MNLGESAAEFRQLEIGTSRTVFDAPHEQVHVLPFLSRSSRYVRARFFAIESAIEECDLSESELARFELSPHLITTDSASIRLLNQSRSDEDALIPAMCTALAAVTGIDLCERSLKILIGHWLRRIIETFHNRVFKFQSAVSRNARLTIHLIEPPVHLTPLNSLDYLFLTNVSGFRFWFNQSVIENFTKAMTFDQSSLTFVKDDQANLEFSYPSTNFGNDRPSRRASKILIRFLQKSVSQKSVFASPYIPWFPVLISQIWQCRLPHIVVETGSTKTPRDAKMREDLLAELRGALGTQNMMGLEAIVVEFLPTIYLEGISSLFEEVRKSSLPKNPRVIFAGNHFDTNELFKAYVSQKTTHGAKYIVNQHGNNYGVHRFLSPTVEEETADIFLTWGWSRVEPLATPYGIGRNIYRRGVKPDPTGALLVVRKTQSFAFGVVDGRHEYRNSERNEIRLLKSLAPAVQAKTTIRSHSFQKHALIEQNDIDLTASELGMRFSSRAFLDELKFTRLALFTYDSTGFLELVNLEFPAIIFSPTGFEHVDNRWTDLYSKLQTANLAFSSAEDAAEHIRKVWDDVDLWWNSPQTVSARSQLVSSLALTVRAPIRDLLRTLPS